MLRLSVEPGRAPFVGRQRELEFLEDLAARAAGGEPQIVFIEGGPGLGKSRLLGEVASRRAASGWLMLRGDADELPTTSAYGPFVTALRSYADGHGMAALRAHVGDWAPHLAPVVPELDEGRSPSRVVPSDAAVVAEAFAQTLRSMTASGPALVAIDDLQWADEASHELLRYLRRRLRGSPLMVICADRGEAGRRGGDRPHIGGELARARLATLLTLGRLDSVASRQLVEGLVGGIAGPRLVEVVLREGEGDPFIIEELMRGLADTGRIVSTGDAWELSGDEPAGLPAGIRDALDARLSGLPPDARETLARAAVVGRRVSAEQVAAVAEQPLDWVEGVLAAAAGRGFLRAEDPTTFEFAHDKIREALYSSLGASDRRRAHELAVDVLTGSRVRVDPVRVAHHALRGDHPQRAVAPLLAAGDAAAGAGAPIDAAEQYQAAATVLRAAGPTRALADALLRLGSALAAGGRYDAAIDALDEALRLARSQVGKLDADWVVAAGSLERLARVHLAREHPEPAEASLRAALEVLDDAAEAGGPDLGEMRRRVLLLLARLFVTVTGRLDEGARVAGLARDLATAGGDVRHEAEALALLGQAAMHAGDFEAGRRHFDGAVAIVDPVLDPSLAADTADGLTRLSFWTASFHRAADSAASELDAARRTGDPHRLGWPTFWLAQAALGLGDWPTVRMRASELVDLGTRLGARRLIGQGHELLGVVAYWTGSYAEACAEIETGLGHLRLIGPGTVIYYLGPYGLALLAAGRTAEGEAILAELRTLADTFPRHSSPRVQAHNVAARIAIGLGRRDLAERDELRGAERQFHWFPVASTLALISLPDDIPAATRHAAIAREVVTAGGGMVHLAEVLVVEARLAAARGDTASAAALRRRAVDLVRARGASPIAAGISPAADLVGPMPVPPGGALSARELEVLAHVARGSTNREIADALSISEKTVVNHVTHVLDKVGVSNRAAATSWAIRNGVA